MPDPQGGTKSTLVAIERSNGEFGRHDVDGVMKAMTAMTDDCVFAFSVRRGLSS